MGKVSKDADLSRALRKALGGVTQAELATKLLVSRNYISQIEASLKEPSKRLRLQMEELLKESAPRPDKVSSTADGARDDAFALGEEMQAPYGSADSLRREILKQVQDTIALAGDDVGKLGWLREQVIRHASAPEHWEIMAKIIAREGPREDMKDEAARGRLESQSARAAQGKAS
jgi:transcriptional regulator with XRE-family HTH domain